MSELRWTYGGNGSHWDGCAEVHWDCKIAQLEAEITALKSEIVSKDKKLTDYEKELRKLHNYDKTCSTCRYLDENQDCVLGIRCVNYALWQGRIL